MAITALPTPPSRSDPTNFADRGDAFLGQLPQFATEANVLAADVNDKQVIASTAATTATNAATTASTASSLAVSAGGATLWVSGTTYAVGATVISPLKLGNSYRRKIAGAGTTDPSLDATNWTPVLFGLQIVNTHTDSVTVTSASIGYHITAMTAIGKSITLPAASDLAVGGPRIVIDNTDGDYPVGVLDGAGNCLGSILEGDKIVGYLADNSSSAGEWKFEGNLSPLWQTAEAGVIPSSGSGTLRKIDEDRSFLVATNSSGFPTLAYVSHPSNGSVTAGSTYVIATTASTVNDLTIVSGNRALVRYNNTSYALVDYSSGATLSIGTPVVYGGGTPSMLVNLDSRYYVAVTGAIGAPAAITAYCIDCGASGTTLTIGSGVNSSFADNTTPAMTYLASATASTTVATVMIGYNESGTLNRKIYLNTITRSTGTTLVFGTPAAQPTNILSSTSTVFAVSMVTATTYLLSYASTTGYNVVVSSLTTSPVHNTAVLTGLDINPGTPIIFNKLGSSYVLTGAQSSTFKIVALTVSGTTITLGSATTLPSATSSTALQAIGSDGKAILSYSIPSSTRVVGLSVSGTTITLGTSQVFGNFTNTGGPLQTTLYGFYAVDGATPIRFLVIHYPSSTGSSICRVSIDSSGIVTLGPQGHISEKVFSSIPLDSQLSNTRAVVSSTATGRSMAAVYVNGEWKYGAGSGVLYKTPTYYVQTNTSGLGIATADFRFDRSATLFRVRFAER